MKPQIVSFNASEAGRNNVDLANSVSKLTKGGSWKKQRVVMLIPASESIPTKVYLSHCSLIFPPNQSSFKMAAIGCNRLSCGTSSK